jgi:hypothetical protein
MAQALERSVLDTHQSPDAATLVDRQNPGLDRHRVNAWP